MNKIYNKTLFVLYTLWGEILRVFPNFQLSNSYMLPCLKYKRKIIAGPESTTSVNDANCAKTDQLIICLNNILYIYIKAL